MLSQRSLEMTAKSQYTCVLRTSQPAAVTSKDMACYHCELLTVAASCHDVCRFTFFIGQVFLTILCGLKWGTFLFFAGWVLIMTIFVILCIPETKGVPIEELSEVIVNHHWVSALGNTDPHG
eukprot:GHUV01033323.1.p1 GENE.GHUV01033323.1~~GHUV01033323.1.p1  ORF type:complete len:122 (-),score=27.68 GHUV01033323.1:70-435(-)